MSDLSPGDRLRTEQAAAMRAQQRAALTAATTAVLGSLLILGGLAGLVAVAFTVDPRAGWGAASILAILTGAALTRRDG